jgi:hypothetical protein
MGGRLVECIQMRSGQTQSAATRSCGGSSPAGAPQKQDRRFPSISRTGGGVLFDAGLRQLGVSSWNYFEDNLLFIWLLKARRMNFIIGILRVNILNYPFLMKTTSLY